MGTFPFWNTFPRGSFRIWRKAMRTVILISAAALALCACETAPARAPARVAEHHPTGAETAQRGTAMQVTLDKVSNPEGRLAHASVQDKNGEKVGTVRKVFV